MVFISNEVLTKLKTTITTASVGDGNQDITPTFPCITFKQTNNQLGIKDSAGEYSSTLTFEINIFTTGQKKVSDCDKLIQSVDSIMSGVYGMNRDTSMRVENYGDINIYRHLIRYSCVITKSKEIFGR